MSRPELGHVTAEMLERYAAGTADTGPAAVWWAVEAHLESCAACRDRLAEAVARCAPATAGVVERVRGELSDLLDNAAAAAQAQPRRSGFSGGAALAGAQVRPKRVALLGGVAGQGWARRWVWRGVRGRMRLGQAARRWAAPVLLPRLAMTVLVVVAAVLLDLVDRAADGRFPSLVLLLAPAAPLLAVSAAWSRGIDPAYELVVSSPRAGLDLVLRRCVAVLAVVIPVLALAGWLAGASPARWLLPCLALTTGALALGDLVGLHRAALGLGFAWIAAVAGPSLVTGRASVLLGPAAVVGWAAATAVVVAVLLVRRRAYTVLASGR